MKHTSTTIPRFCLWLAAGAACAIGLAWLSVQLQKGAFAPVGLLSLLIGGSLGGSLATLLRFLEFGNRRAALCGSLVLAVVAVIGQHWFAYRDYRAVYEEALRSDPKLAFARAGGDGLAPRTFFEYMRPADNRGRLVYWGLDLVLVVAATAGVVAWSVRTTPYCPHCRQWHRLLRRGPLRDEQAAALADTLDLPLPAGASHFRFRLTGCPGGCSPGRLTLKWIHPDQAPAHARRELTDQQMHQINSHLANRDSS